jgi:hypothetical protein
MFSGVFIAEKADGVGERVRSYHSSCYTDTFDGLFEHVCEICLFH